MSQEFNPADPFALWRQFWQNAAPGASQAFLPPLSAEEIDRKLSELRVVENWMAMNMGMLAMQIKTLELQKAALASLKQPPE